MNKKQKWRLAPKYPGCHDQYTCKDWDCETIGTVKQSRYLTISAGCVRHRAISLVDRPSMHTIWNFYVTFDQENQHQSPKTIESLTERFCIFGLNLATLAWMGHMSSRGEAWGWHAHTHTHTRMRGHTDRQRQYPKTKTSPRWERVEILSPCQGRFI